jgi:hypothetical protein
MQSKQPKSRKEFEKWMATVRSDDENAMGVILRSPVATPNEQN